ncbi:MAG: DUF262 domain-containing protein [Sulfurimonas sp.]|jgi:uncharacterized protein with ParB-like and HNH nuclease domain
MSEIITCDKSNNMPKNLIESLNFNQGGVGRHKCVLCAYQNGIKDGEKKALDFTKDDEIEECQHGRKAIRTSIENIHINQKPTQGRHKCAICAYHLGYEVGVGDRENDFDEFSEDETEDENAIYDITTFGTSADVRTIYNRLSKKKYYIPLFQRDYVWDDSKASKLIESLVMGLPIPSIFLAKDEGKDENYYIIDGQQRLKSIERFYNGEFVLKNVAKKLDKLDFNGKKYDELDEKLKDRIDEYAIQLIIIKQDKPDDNNDSIYKIFERINTLGKSLTPQEIRASSYHGKFNELLSQLAKKDEWIDFIQMKNSRKSHEELILRFLALYFDLENYKAPMKHFLNIYMNKNRHFKYNSKNDIEEIFGKTLEICSQFLTKEDICLIGSNRVNTQLLDSILVGIAKNIDNPKLKNSEYIKTKIDTLKTSIDDENYLYKDYWESRNSKTEFVKGRCEITIGLFGE